MTSEPIVAGTDGSRTAELAVEKAGELARALGVTVHVVSSYSAAGAPGAWMAAATGVAVVDVLPDQQARERAEEIVARAGRRLSELGVEALTHVSDADPADALITVAGDVKAQMIVVGNRGMSGARRMLGSVPNRVSHHAKCGVLIVPTC
jgi:nucleotide-binding universal stress UspA family protein